MDSKRRSYKAQMSRLREFNQILQNGIQPNAILPPRLQVPSAGIHFYKYGLFFFRDPKIKRKFYYNPFFIIFMELFYLSRSLVSLHVPDTYRQYFIYSGDYMYFIRAKTHINIAATQYMSLGICILIMNFINYRMGVEPIFLKSIAFLRGQCTPASCGLHNRKYILSFIRQAKYSLKITDFNTKAVFVVSFLLSFLPAVLNFTLFEVFAYGIPWSAVFALSSYYTFSSYFWNLTYFFIVCHYIKYRIRQTNDAASRLQNLSPGWQKWQMKVIERDFVNTSCMVDQWSGTYWSKYLAIAITLLSTFNNTVFYTALFVDMNIIVKISLFYATTLSSSAIFFLLQTAAIVCHESGRTPKILYKISLTYNENSIKINTLIETFSKKRIGFYFSNLFIINYFRFYEIFGLLIAYFLRIIELSRES